MVVSRVRLGRLPVLSKAYVRAASASRQTVRTVRRAAANQFAVSCVVAALLTLAGFGAFYLAWRGSAATLVVGVQLAYLLSGGFAGAALLTVGIGIFSIQVTRHLEARENDHLDELLDRTLGLLSALKDNGVEENRGEHTG